MLVDDVATPATSASGSVGLPVAAGRWVLDAAHSHVGFSVRHLGIANVRGQFSDVDVTLRVGRHLDDVRLYVRLGTGSVTTDVEAEELWRRHLTDAGKVLVTDQASSVVDLLA